MYTPSVSVMDLIQTGQKHLLDGVAVFSCNRIPVVNILPKTTKTRTEVESAKAETDKKSTQALAAYHRCSACSVNLKNAAMHCSLKCAQAWRWKRKTARKPGRPARSFVC